MAVGRCLWKEMTVRTAGSVGDPPLVLPTLFVLLTSTKSTRELIEMASVVFLTFCQR